MLPYRRQMQIIFQDPFSSLDPKMTVSQIIEGTFKDPQRYMRRSMIVKTALKN